MNPLILVCHFRPAKEIIHQLTSFSNVQVTGGTGFLGSHVVAQLLEKGYRVRSAARSATKQRKIFPDNPNLEVVEIPTLTSNYTESLKGADAVIHIAAQLFAKTNSVDEIYEVCPLYHFGFFLAIDFVLQAACDGTINIVNQSIEAGVKKIIITGTFASLFDSQTSIYVSHRSCADSSLAQLKTGSGTKLVTEEFYNPVTPETFHRDQPLMAAYQESKTLASKRVWEVAEKHPDVDFTICGST